MPDSRHIIPISLLVLGVAVSVYGLVAIVLSQSLLELVKGIIIFIIGIPSGILSSIAIFSVFYD